MSYRPILDERGVQVGYVDGDSAYDLRGKMAYHLGRDGALMRLGDGKVVGSLADLGWAFSLSEGDVLFSY